MRITGQQRHPHFNLDGGAPQGPKYIIRPAKDPMAKAPEDSLILALLTATLCRAKLDEDARLWRVTGMTGRYVLLSLGATYAEWERECNALLAEAIKEAVQDES